MRRKEKNKQQKMNNQQMKDNSFVLFLNESTNPKAPQYTGKGIRNGQKHDIAAWKKVGKNGKTFLSGSYKDPWTKGEQDQQDAF